MLPVLSLLVAALAPVRAESVNASTAYAEGALGPSPNQTFKSSNSTPVMWNFIKYPESQTPGVIFMAPWGDNVTSPGPFIFEENGDLVWDGTRDGFGQTFAYQTFQYQNQTVIGLWQGQFMPGGYGNGHGIILDNTYRVIANISATVPNATEDMHEFRITDNGTALISVYANEPYNLSAWGVAPANGSMMLVGHFQEIDIATGKTLFSWRSLDHVHPDECYTTPQLTGTTAKVGWDYFHINAIDKDAKGNYIVSSRHCHAVYYIDGKDGSIIWRLGGRNSTLTMGPGVEFSWQHHVRFRANNTISIFDNGGAALADTRVNSSTAARGIHLSIDEEARRADLIWQGLPIHRIPTYSQGSVEPTANGNWLIGWGASPWMSEYASTGEQLTKTTGVSLNNTDMPGLNATNGTLLWGAQFGTVQASVQGYRIFREQWHAYPRTTPNLTAVANGSNVDLYMSWNGATEVATWEVLGGNDTNTTGHSLSNTTRAGFETHVTVPSDHGSVFQAIARSANGSTLGFSNFASINGSNAPPTPEQSGQAQVPPLPSFTAQAAANATGNSTMAANDKSAAVGTTVPHVAAVIVLVAGVLTVL